MCMLLVHGACHATPDITLVFHGSFLIVSVYMYICPLFSCPSAWCGQGPADSVGCFNHAARIKHVQQLEPKHAPPGTTVP